jgi:U6 snRNA-associated Sm-like protein LSm7
MGTDPQPHTRSLGLAVLRGPTITILSPVDGSEVRTHRFLASHRRVLTALGG